MKATKTEPVNTNFDDIMTYYRGEGSSPPIQSPHESTMCATRNQVSRDEMDNLFNMCRANDWHGILACVRENPSVALTPMIMDNHIATTLIHQAITSKGVTAVRAEVISTILRATPQAAAIKNGYGSFPIHVIAQRNTKIDAQTKERLIYELVNAHKAALLEEGGVGKRTPLHIIFTDYISPRVTRMMIDNGHQACFMKDKKGFLPAHVACSRHCSPEKLRMLLDVYPGSMYEKTNEGKTLLDLAKTTATKSHPNYALIEELNRQLANANQIGRVSSEEDDSMSARSRLNSNDSAKSWYTAPVGESPSFATTTTTASSTTNSPPYHAHSYNNHNGMMMHSPAPYNTRMSTTMMFSNNSPPPYHPHDGMTNSPAYNHHQHHHSYPYMQTTTMTTTVEPHMDMMPPAMPTPTPTKNRASRKRKSRHHREDPAADLLLHFSRQPPSTRNHNLEYATGDSGGSLDIAAPMHQLEIAASSPPQHQQQHHLDEDGGRIEQV